MNNKQYDEFLNLLKRYIGSKSIRQFASEIGINASSLSRILSKKAIPSRKTVIKIGAVPSEDESVSYNDLLKAADEMLGKEKDDEDSRINIVITDNYKFAVAIKESMKKGDLKGFKVQVKFVNV